MSRAKPTLILIDAHAVIHRAYHALPDLTTPEGAPAGALYGVSAMLVKLIKELAPDYMVAAYDRPEKTHRHEVYEAYKGTRAEVEEELIAQFDRSRDIFSAFHIPIYDAPGFEADDIIGTIVEKEKDHFSIIIASGDMDTLQLVRGDTVRVFTLKKGIQDTVLYDEEAVNDRFGFPPRHLVDYKGLRGDPSDNIIGVRGVGEKTATKLIQTYGTIEQIYAELKKDKESVKKKAGITERVAQILIENEEEAEFSKVLATIRTDAPVTFQKEDADWHAHFTPARALTLFTELGFRSLVQRMKELAPTKDSPTLKEGVARADDDGLEEGERVDTKSRLFEEAAVMLWLLESEVTNPSPEDILLRTKTHTIHNAHKILEAEIKKNELTTVYAQIEKPLIPVIKKMNANGVLIDKQYLKNLSDEYHQELDLIAKRVYNHAGVEFNISSPKQLGEILFQKLDIKIEGGRRKKTATGQLSTKESELIKLKTAHPIIEDILQYRELSKLLGTYIDAIPPLLGKDGRLRTTFSQTGTTTGRLSSRDPNLQNIPIKTDLGRRIRRAFIAPPGRLLIALDYSQIELRIAAFLSGDTTLKDIFKRGGDIHTAVAAKMFSVEERAVTYEMRRKAKAINFGILYGMGANALKDNLGVERNEAQEYLTRYFETFSGLSEYIARIKADAARKGFVTTYFGRRRYFPGITSKLPFVRAQAERMAMNAPMQGTQADIIKLAMIKIHSFIESECAGDVAMILQIHDELMFEVAEEKGEVFGKEAKRIMESILTEKEVGIPITVSGERGLNWAEMEKL